jgi:hypothetical protein
MRKLALLLIPALTTGILTSLPQAAHATGLDQVCAVTEIVTYTPAVTNTPQNVTVTVHGNLFTCTSSSAPTGSYTETALEPGITCTNLLASASGTRIFHWTNTAIAPSTFTYNLTGTAVNGTAQATFLGEIAAGTFTPDPAKEEVTGPVPDPITCLTTGVSQTTYIGTLEIGI